jgi:hypothetical protein
MSGVVLTVVVVWLVLSVVTTVACALVTRGGLEEDGRRGYLDDELTALLAAGSATAGVRAPGARAR